MTISVCKFYMYQRRCLCDPVHETRHYGNSCTIVVLKETLCLQSQVHSAMVASFVHIFKGGIQQAKRLVLYLPV